MSNEKSVLAASEHPPCFCDARGIGVPGVSCGDCPTRDYMRPSKTTDKPKRPQGRPAKPPEQRAAVACNIRLTQAQRDKLERLGGAAWVRAQIEKAREVKSE